MIAEEAEKFDNCFDITREGLINGRSIKRNTGRRSGVEIRRRMHFHDTDFYYRLLGARICEMLTTDFTDL